MPNERNVGGEKAKHRIFYIFLFGFCLLVWVRNVFMIKFPVFLFIIYAAFMSVFITRDEQVALVVSMLPLGNAFQYRYILYICAVALVIKKREKFCLRKALPVLLLMICELSHSSTSNVTLYGFLQEFSELLIIALLLMDEPTTYSDALPLRTMAFVSAFSGLASIVKSIVLYGFSLDTVTRIGKIGVDAVADFEGLLNPNAIGFMCMLSISGLLLINFYGKSYKSDTYLLSFMVVVLILSQSRSAILLTMLTYFLYFICSREYRHIRIPKMCVFLCFLLFGIVTGLTIFGEVFYSLFERFRAEDFSNGRTTIFSFYHMHLCRNTGNWLWGVGLYRYPSQMMKIYGNLWISYPGLSTYANDEIVYKVSHNGMQEILVAWGVPGIILIVWLLYLCCKHQYKWNKTGINYITLFIVLLYSIQGQFLTSGGYLIGLIFAIICLEYYPKDFYFVNGNTLARTLQEYRFISIDILQNGGEHNEPELH